MIEYGSLYTRSWQNIRLVIAISHYTKLLLHPSNLLLNLYIHKY